jgi:hypothetical protein
VANVFISYRRSDSAPYAGRLYDRLTAHFSDPQVFMDLEIRPGDDFVERVEQGVSQCDVLLVLIGPSWLGALDDDGKRRLDDPADFARIEIATALARDIRVIPVLVGGGVMPTMRDLPEDLVPLGRRQAVELTDLRFRTDADALITVIDEELDARASAETERQEAPKAEVSVGVAEHERSAPDAERKPTAAADRVAGGSQTESPGAHADKRADGAVTSSQRRALIALGIVAAVAVMVVVAVTLLSGESSSSADVSLKIVSTNHILSFEPAENFELKSGEALGVKNDTSKSIRVDVSRLRGCPADSCQLGPHAEVTLTAVGQPGEKGALQISRLATTTEPYVLFSITD